MRNTVRFLPKQGHLQPHFHSKARQLSTTVKKRPIYLQLIIYTMKLSVDLLLIHIK